MSKNTIKTIFWSAGLFNIGAGLIFSLLFTNPYPARYYPSVFSDFGLIIIMLWGLAYISVSSTYMHVRGLMLIFTIEKLIYFITWIWFLVDKGSMLPGILSESFITGLALSSYGSVDFLFGCFFAWVWFKGYKVTS
ncbi:MAG TPA: hypothetical protein PK358_09670 [Spirochaetota bacterium]|nr:hypothetical protein [Spirochaetota bacterium]HPJ35090.1 hypothetical protein [Spirochaetota bacterium]